MAEKENKEVEFDAVIDVEFEIPDKLEQLNSGEQLPILFGKIAKFMQERTFTDALIDEYGARYGEIYCDQTGVVLYVSASMAPGQSLRLTVGADAKGNEKVVWYTDVVSISLCEGVSYTDAEIQKLLGTSIRSNNTAYLYSSPTGTIRLPFTKEIRRTYSSDGIRQVLGGSIDAGDISSLNPNNAQYITFTANTYGRRLDNKATLLNTITIATDVPEGKEHVTLNFSTKPISTDAIVHLARHIEYPLQYSSRSYSGDKMRPGIGDLLRCYGYDYEVSVDTGATFIGFSNLAQVTITETVLGDGIGKEYFLSAVEAKQRMQNNALRGILQYLETSGDGSAAYDDTKLWEAVNDLKGHTVQEYYVDATSSINNKALLICTFYRDSGSTYGSATFLIEAQYRSPNSVGLLTISVETSAGNVYVYAQWPLWTVPDNTVKDNDSDAIYNYFHYLVKDDRVEVYFTPKAVTPLEIILLDTPKVGTLQADTDAGDTKYDIQFEMNCNANNHYTSNMYITKPDNLVKIPLGYVYNPNIADVEPPLVPAMEMWRSSTQCSMYSLGYIDTDSRDYAFVWDVFDEKRRYLGTARLIVYVVNGQSVESGMLNFTPAVNMPENADLEDIEVWVKVDTTTQAVSVAMHPKSSGTSYYSFIPINYTPKQSTYTKIDYDADVKVNYKLIGTLTADMLKVE